ncbi:7 transmembrane sweet-taste receptor of 3 GCPR-domain-containing protein [Polychytrium aggregatum]|uniref:7 transmembrane sweet-taste receptor of 3 GCPR-domain-containing protein n=1 Tax=Polychytrium aggregatum TaxID=110093 RepID=UPI0022FDC52D|nr:7 transmembrane sweet-taste receptor of 3 GCPR-domain-containing protein [Polychytrium aggregatum]KAI9208999.1 7 transmembrane sweet-taste receptor of 3 GCPR-domain-containing protein [Polychytrium aggregatum]
MIYLKRHPLVMKRGPLFNSILLVGLCLWGVQSVIDIANVGSNTWICYIQPWLMGLGFSLVTSSICVKAWRLWCIFDNAKLVRRNLSDSFLLTITGVFCLTETILLAVNHGMNPQSVTVTQIGLRKLQLCTPNNTSVSSGTIGALYALNGIFLLLCVFLAYKTRNVPRQFGEALETSISVYTIVLACIIILPNVGSNTQSLRERSVIRLFVQWFCLTVIQHMLISPILMVVYKETHAGTIGSSVMTQSKSTGSAAANRVRGAEDYKLSDKKLAFEEFSFIWKDTGSFFPQKWKKINCIICRAPENPFLVFEDSKNPKEKGFIVTIAAINGLLFTDSNEKTLALTWSAGSFLLTARPGTNIQEWYSAVSEMISEVRASMQEDSAKTAAGAKGSAAKTKASKG